MKKLLLGSVALFLFSLSVLMFQISCQKPASAQGTTGSYTLPPATTTSLGGVIIGSGLNVTSNGTLSVTATNGIQQLNKVIFTKELSGGGIEFWTMNYDGSNKTKINITMPAGTELNDDRPKLSPDGQKVFFIGRTSSATQNDDDIYSCNIDGSNVVKLYDMPVGTGHTFIGGAY